jgi:hypothetical protein
VPSPHFVHHGFSKQTDFDPHPGLQMVLEVTEQLGAGRLDEQMQVAFPLVLLPEVVLLRCVPK